MLKGTKNNTGDSMIVKNHDRSLAIVSTVGSARVVHMQVRHTERDTSKSYQRPTEEDKDGPSSSRQPVGESLNFLKTSYDYARAASKHLHAGEGLVALAFEAKYGMKGGGDADWKLRLDAVRHDILKSSQRVLYRI